jgi:hypothetical protein
MRSAVMNDGAARVPGDQTLRTAARATDWTLRAKFCAWSSARRGRRRIMGRRSKKHPAYRTKEELVKDVTFVLNAPLTRGTKHVVCKEAFSTWSEFEGKYKGCRLWSRAAFEKLRKCAHWEDESISCRRWRTGIRSELRHEHAVPKKVLMDLLLRLENPTEDTVCLCLDLAVGVVVTTEEEKRLNESFKSDMPEGSCGDGGPASLDPLARYKRCDIEVVELEWSKKWRVYFAAEKASMGQLTATK